MNVSTRIECPKNMDAAEWEIRCDLAALYRLMAHYRMTDFIYTHISARLPGPEHHFLINQFGVLFEDMRASDLVKIDMDANIIDQDEANSKLINAAGFTIHSAIHAAREDLTCVVHTHTAAGMAVSAQAHGLLPITQHALKFYNRLSYHGYEGIALELDERPRLVADLGPTNRAMILHNHGLLAAGRSIPEAFLEIYYLERACQAQISALAGGAKLIFPPVAVQEHTAKQFNPPEPYYSAHLKMAWQSALKVIDHSETDYRT
ncbi:MAG: class II aldolase [Acidocella sp. 20-57-95]|nr:MAG: class II aldolase [Acidocella sp. 20-57-95]OYV59976.1 MAG: class II aldolase [Acidocella sp. 21-58-7]HQT64332.1 class II aldolase/adducin family protein [Acidocella sp.]HQU03803.1 class II aldolase/adducin family protein [Acidocella sp.]